jgi:hypothetical protein
LSEVREGGFKVCFNQGLNVRLMTQEAARELATVDYRDDGFKTRRLYTAWDNLKDEEVFFRGVDTLEAAGIPPIAISPRVAPNSARVRAFSANSAWKRDGLPRVLLTFSMC